MNIPHDWTTEADSESLWSAPIRMYTPALRISVHIYSRSVCLNHIWPWEYIVDTLSELVALFMDDMFLLSILLGWLSLKKQINTPLYYFFVKSGQLTYVWLLRKIAEWIEHAKKHSHQTILKSKNSNKYTVKLWYTIIDWVVLQITK